LPKGEASIVLPISLEVSTVIGTRLRELREDKNLSQGDIEVRTGLLRCYVSRVEHGHTVPSLETLEKFARALEVPLYQLVYDGNEPIKPSARPKSNNGKKLWGESRLEIRQLNKLVGYLSKMREPDRLLLMVVAQHAVGRGSSHKRREQ
jgi:transcriptional regulator with XRE-family HTH domain